MSHDTFQQASSDAVDGTVAAWAVEKPELDTTAKHVTGRIVRLGALFQQAFGESSVTVGLDNADFGILAALRRAGPDYAVTPTELARRRMMTSGGMTAAIDRLDRRGLVERVPNPADRRGNLVRLTDEGRDAIDRAIELQQDVELRLVAPLDDAEIGQLTDLLRRLLVAADPQSQRGG